MWHSEVTLGVCNGSQRLDNNSWHQPTGEGSTPCITTSEKSLSCGIWGKASPTPPLPTGTQRNPSCSHPGLQDYQSLARLMPRDAKRVHLQVTASTKMSSSYKRVVKYRNKLPIPLILSSSVPILKKNCWTMNGPLNFCYPSLIFFSIL